MIYNFITDKDLDVGMKKYFRDQITNGNTNLHILKTSEGAAFTMIKTALNGRYDLTKLFPVIEAWDEDSVFVEGDYTFQNDIFYKAKQASQAVDPASDGGDEVWKISDPRDQLLIVFAVSITLYFFVESINPRKISDDIINAYTTAVEWLDDVTNGKRNPDFPLLQSGGSNDIPHGSNSPLQHYY